jgi:hypothetical protein
MGSEAVAVMVHAIEARDLKPTYAPTLFSFLFFKAFLQISSNTPQYIVSARLIHFISFD